MGLRELPLGLKCGIVQSRFFEWLALYLGFFNYFHVNVALSQSYNSQTYRFLSQRMP